MNPKDIYNQLPQSTKEKLLNPTAKNIGETLGGVSELLLSPINILTSWSNAYIRKFKQSIIDNVNKIPEENRDPSKLNLAMKTIEDSKYQIANDDLREMFAKLVAASIDKNKSKNLSPRFSTILSQLSPSDAKLLKDLSFNTELPIPTVIYTIDTGAKNYYPFLDHYIGINYSKDNIVQNEAGLDTLSSLGIIQIKDNFEISEEHIQSFYKEMKYAEYPIKSFDGKAERNIRIENGIIKFTEFGLNFLKAVI